MSDLRVGQKLSQVTATALASSGELSAAERAHLERFLELPSLQQRHEPAQFGTPSLAQSVQNYAEPELQNPQVLRSQNFVRILESIDESLEANQGDSDPVVRLTRLVVNQELSKQKLLRDQLAALVER